MTIVYHGTNRAMVSVPHESYYIFSLVDDLERMMVWVLQRFFHKNSISNLFTTDSPNAFENVYISSEFGIEERRLPHLVVSVQNVSEQQASFGNALGEFVGEDDRRYVRYGGFWEFDVQMQIKTGDPNSRNVVGDILLLGLVYPIRKYLERRRVIIQPNSIRMMGKSESSLVETGAERKVYNLAVVFRAKVEWIRDFVYDSYDLESISLDPQIEDF